MTREEFEQYAKEQGLVVWSKETSDKAINALTAIEDIKKEIIEKDEYMIDSNGLFVYALSTDDILKIIDKHTKGE